MTNPQSRLSLRDKFRQHIAYRLGLGVFLMTTLAMGLVGTFVHFQTRSQYNQEHLGQAQQISGIVVDEVSALMMTGGGAEVWAKVLEMANLVDKTSGVSRILLLGNHGNVKVSSDSAFNDKTLELSNNPECPSCDSVDAADFPVSKIVTDASQHRQLRVINQLAPNRNARSAIRRQTRLAAWLSSISTWRRAIDPPGKV